MSEESLESRLEKRLSAIEKQLNTLQERLDLKEQEKKEHTQSEIPLKEPPAPKEEFKKQDLLPEKEEISENTDNA